jgi:hypothetical protein
MSEKPERRFDMKTKKKRIAQEIQSRILTIVIAIFMVVAVVVAVMVGNVSLSAQKNDLEMQSKAASYQLEIFFQEYMTIVEQMALDKDVRIVCLRKIGGVLTSGVLGAEGRKVFECVAFARRGGKPGSDVTLLPFSAKEKACELCWEPVIFALQLLRPS